MIEFFQRWTTSEGVTIRKSRQKKRLRVGGRGNDTERNDSLMLIQDAKQGRHYSLLFIGCL